MEGKGINQTVPSQQEINHKYATYIKYGLLCFAVIFVIISSVIGISAYNILKYNYIYQGVYIGDVHVGGESRVSATEKLVDTYQKSLEDSSITITGKGISEDISYREINSVYTINQAVSQAYNIGRKGNVIKRLLVISRTKKENVNIDLNIQTNAEKITEKVKMFAEKTNVLVKEHQIDVLEEHIKISKGESGNKLNEQQAIEKIIEAVTAYQQDSITLTYSGVEPKPVEVDVLYDDIFIQPEDAFYEVEDYRLNIVPHVIGRKFDKEEAQKLINEGKSKQEIYIPLQLLQPSLLKEELEKVLFRDELSSYTTKFDASNKGRSHNIELASGKIHGTVLAPGQEFSFNEVVGKRTKEMGYQSANVYFGDEIIDGIGGGICQVSSTLYNTTLYYDLEITKRFNHSMTVSYVPLGQDAAVAYGILDFAFANNTEWPIKIVTEIETGKNTFKIIGTNEKPGRTVKLEYEVLKEEPFPTEQKEDDELEEGKKVIKQTGGKGYVVNTYKIIKQDGEVKSRELITRSSYHPIKQIEIIGTKKIDDTNDEYGETEDNEPFFENEEPVEPIPYE